MNLNNKKVLVVGLGSTGLSVLAFCRHQGVSVAAYDAVVDEQKHAHLRQNFPDLVVFSGSLNDALAEQDVLVLSPGISRRLPEIVAFEQRGGVVTGDVAILAEILRDAPDKIVAITGSNGKTTVTELVGYLCKNSGLDTVVAGNIGTPVLSAWLERGGKPADVWVLELSSFQLETTPQLNADAAVCLNVSEDHLDRYDDLLDYARSKDLIFNGKGVQVLNADDALCCAMKRDDGRAVRYFSLCSAADYALVGDHLTAQNTPVLAQNQLRLQGKHNVANVLAALALCETLGLAREPLLALVQNFQGLPHRVEKIGEKNGVVFIDDSKGTNVGATYAAVAGLSQPIVLIAGGVGKGQDFTPLRDVVRDKARAVLLIGVDAEKIAEDLKGCDVPVAFCGDLPEAVQCAYHLAQKGDVVLLSPACASLDMFKNYAHRAEVFIEAFKQL